jgi:hypothetical protein
MKTGYSHDPDTTASYCPFVLLKKRKTGAKVLDDNLIWVASDYRDTGGLACLYHDTFGRNAYFQQR